MPYVRTIVVVGVVTGMVTMVICVAMELDVVLVVGMAIVVFGGHLGGGGSICICCSQQSASVIMSVEGTKERGLAMDECVRVSAHMHMHDMCMHVSALMLSCCAEHGGAPADTRLVQEHE